VKNGCAFDMSSLTGESLPFQPNLDRNAEPTMENRGATYPAILVAGNLKGVVAATGEQRFNYQLLSLTGVAKKSKISESKRVELALIGIEIRDLPENKNDVDLVLMDWRVLVDANDHGSIDGPKIVAAIKEVSGAENLGFFGFDHEMDEMESFICSTLGLGSVQRNALDALFICNGDFFLSDAFTKAVVIGGRTYLGPARRDKFLVIAFSPNVANLFYLLTRLASCVIYDGQFDSLYLAIKEVSQSHSNCTIA